MQDKLAPNTLSNMSERIPVRASLTPVCCLLVVIGASAVCNNLIEAAVPRSKQNFIDSGFFLDDGDNNVELLKTKNQNSIDDKWDEQNRHHVSSAKQRNVKLESSIVTTRPTTRASLNLVPFEIVENNSDAEISVVDSGDRSEDDTNEGNRLQATPQYMLDLYNKFSTDKYSHPIANIVRSFTNFNRGL